MEGAYQQILYDSATNTLSLTISPSSTARKPRKNVKTNSNQSQSLTQSSRKISEPDREKIVQSLESNGFFQSDVYYPPNPLRPQDYTVMVLAAILDGKLRTVTWTDISRNVPTGLTSIVEFIQKIASE
jgi:hypothetical protein